MSCLRNHSNFPSTTSQRSVSFQIAKQDQSKKTPQANPKSTKSAIPIVDVDDDEACAKRLQEEEHEATLIDPNGEDKATLEG